MGLGSSLCANRQSRMFGRRAGCPGLREEPDVRACGPDVRAGGAGLGALWIACARFLGRCQMFGPLRGAGCPGVGRMSGRYRAAWRPSLSGLLLDGGAGCPGSCRMSGRCSSTATPLEALLIRFRVDLSYASSISMVVSSVPKHM